MGASGVPEQSLGCKRKLLVGWGWKSVEDQCKVLSASLIGLGVVERWCSEPEFARSPVRSHCSFC